MSLQLEEQLYKEAMKVLFFALVFTYFVPKWN